MSDNKKGRYWILGAALGVLLSVPLLFGIERSLHVWPIVLDSGRTGVLLTAQCPACELMFDDYQANPAKWDGIIPVPLDKPGSPFGDAVCEATLDAVSDPRLILAKLLPKRTVCAHLAGDAVAFARSEGMVATPSFFSGGSLVKFDELESLLGFAPFPGSN